MPKVEIRFYEEDDGKCPAFDWLTSLPRAPQAKGWAMLDILAERGNELNRPYAALLRDGIYELRWRRQHVNYRLLYFFHGRSVVILTHGITKKARVPDIEIDTALQRKNLLERKKGI